MLHPVRHSIRKSRLRAVTARDFFFPMYDVWNVFNISVPPLSVFVCIIWFYYTEFWRNRIEGFWGECAYFVGGLCNSFTNLHRHHPLHHLHHLHSHCHCHICYHHNHHPYRCHHTPHHKNRMY